MKGGVALPDLLPKPERQREVAIRKRDQGSHSQGIPRAVQCTSAACKVAGFGPATAFQCRECSPPVNGCRPFNRQHLAQVGPAAPATWALHSCGSARRATLEVAAHCENRVILARGGTVSEVHWS